jgi:hypothetical protein
MFWNEGTIWVGKREVEWEEETYEYIPELWERTGGLRGLDITVALQIHLVLTIERMKNTTASSEYISSSNLRKPH